MTAQEIIAYVKDYRFSDGRIMGLLEDMDDDSEDLGAVMDALDKYRPELRMRLKEEAARNI